MSNKKDISQIRKYLNGELDARAMHELERRALDDPFLMDALEGFEQAKADQQANLDELSERLQQRTDEKVKRMIPWGSIISIAASVLIILGVGLRYLNRTNEPPKQVAEVETPVVKKNVTPQPSVSSGNTAATDSIKAKEYVAAPSSPTLKSKSTIAPSADAAAVAPVAEPPAAADISQYKPVDKEKTAAPGLLKELKIVSNKNVVADTSGFATYSKPVKKPVTTTDQMVTSRAEGVTVVPLPRHNGQAEEEARRLVGSGVTLKQDIARQKPRSRDTSDLNEAVVSSYGSKKKSDPSQYNTNLASASPLTDQLKQSNDGTQRTISGHVNGKDDGLPIVGATVKVIGKNFGVVTDVNGKFILKNVPANANLVIAYVGYNSQKLKVNSSDTLNVSLAPNNNSLSEVVVAGYSAQTGDNTEPEQNARPADGWSAFKKYVEGKATLQDGKAGKVRLSFTVNALGDMTDFKILQSLSKDADQAAIDLVKNGPAWMGNSNQKPQTVKITIKFH